MGAPEDHVAALGALLGMTPGHKMDSTVALVALVAEAQSRGMTWNQIAPTLQCPDGKAAKKKAKEFAAQAQRKMFAEAAKRAGAAE